MFRDIKRADRGFTISGTLRSQYKRLRREIEDVIPSLYNTIDLTRVANDMGITVFDDMKPKHLIRSIANKIILYVAIIEGKTRISTAVINQEPYREILQFTSYAWAAGIPNTNATSIRAMRAQAARARGNRSTYRSEDNSSFFSFFRRTAGTIVDSSLNALSGALGWITGLMQRQNPLDQLRVMPGTQAIRERERRDQLRERLIFSNRKAGGRELDRRAMDEANRRVTPFDVRQPNLEERRREYRNKLLSEAAARGIRAGSVKSVESMDDLARRIYAADHRDDEEQKVLEARRDRLSARGRLGTFLLGNRLNARDQARLDVLQEAKKEKEYARSISGLFGGDKTPYVRLTSIPTDSNFEKVSQLAVPVWVLNQVSPIISGSPTGTPTIGSGSPTYTPTIGSGSPTYTPIIGPIPTTKSRLLNLKPNVNIQAIESSNIRAKQTFEKQLKVTQDNFGMNVSSRRVGRPIKMSSTSGLFPGFVSEAIIRDPFVADISSPKQSFSNKGTYALRVFDMANMITSDEKKTGAKNTFFSDTANGMGLSKYRKEPATPVFVVNKMLPTDTGELLIELGGLLVDSFTAGLGGGAAKSALRLAMGSGGGMNELFNMVGLATGGTGRGLGRSSHFISGDSLTKAPNPEQVSIDWSNKSYSVKPIPAFATGGSESMSGKISRMTASERTKPMSVGISSHLVTYSRELQGVKDDNQKQAIKVFNVNPGISDLVEYGGSSVSLIGLVSNMVTRLENIEELLSINNQISTAAVEATTVVAKNISGLSSSSGRSSNPFAGGFTDELDEILVGI
jgi:hypothetical protein